jgi:hypothetical protein
LSKTNPDDQKGAQTVLLRHIGAGLQKRAVTKVRANKSPIAQ